MIKCTLGGNFYRSPVVFHFNLSVPFVLLCSLWFLLTRSRSWLQFLGCNWVDKSSHCIGQPNYHWLLCERDLILLVFITTILPCLYDNICVYLQVYGLSWIVLLVLIILFKVWNTFYNDLLDCQLSNECYLVCDLLLKIKMLFGLWFESFISCLGS